MLCRRMLDGPTSLRLLSVLTFGSDFRQKGHESRCGRRLSDWYLDRHFEQPRSIAALP
jgi:hypothetical protein